MPKAGDRILVNFTSTANTALVRREKRNGRDVVIVPAATLPDNIVMNGIRYPAEEIEKSFHTLENTPAPLGHPTINGRFLSASLPEGINMGWIGAWNENVRRKDGRVFMDKVIDVEVANRMNGGKDVLAAVEAGEPIHTSTGLYCNLGKTEEGDEAKHTAMNILFDHDAILLDEPGAATPDDGVGMFVNKALSPSGDEVEVLNSSYDWADQELDWAARSVHRAFEAREEAGVIDRIKSAILEMFSSADAAQQQQKETDMPVTDDQFAALSSKVDTIGELVNQDNLTKLIGDAVGEVVNAAIKPLKDNLEAVQNAQEAKDKAELDGYVDKIVKANLLDAEAAGELTLNAAKALADKVKPGKASPIGNGVSPGTNDDDDGWGDYSLNAAIDKKKDAA